jgi:hypothetical protein
VRAITATIVPVIWAFFAPGTPTTGQVERAVRSTDPVAQVPAAVAPAPEPNGGLELVEVLVRGKARGVTEIRREEDVLYVAVSDLADLLELEINDYGPITVVETPLGSAELNEDQLRIIDDRRYVTASDVAAKLGGRVRFDSQTYTLEIDPLWHPAIERQAAPESAEIRAPSASLAGLRATYDHIRQDGLHSSSGTLQMVGRLARGSWYVSAQDATRQTYNLNEYYWYGRRNKMHYLAGRTRLQFITSLGSFQLAGAQIGWGNAKRTGGPRLQGPNALFPRRAAPVETVHGEAVPGNFVQLRIDGRVVGMQQVGFNGKYEFLNVPLPTRQSTGVEVLVFEPSNLRIPVEVRRERLAASAYMVPAGSVSHTGGIGLAGQFNQRVADSDPETTRENGLGGYYMWRQGLSRNVTTEALLQHNGRNLQSYVGAIGRLNEVWVVGGGVTYTPGAVGYQVNGEGFLSRWDFFVDSRITPGEFGLTSSPDVADHRIETRHYTLPQLRLGAIARYHDDESRLVTYVLPTATWRPNRDLYFDARPDFEGRYQLNASWQIDPRSQMRYFRSRSSSLELTRMIGRRWQVGYANLFENIEPRFSVFANLRQYALGGMWFVGAGLVRTLGRNGFTVSASAPVVPGIFARAEYQSLPITTVDGPDDSGRFMLNLVSDFSHSSGRLVAARSESFRRQQGGIVGRIVIDSGSGERGGVRRSDYDLEGIKVFVAHHANGATDGTGRFFIGGLEPGIYSVELDPLELPIELSPERTRVTVEVVSAAATRVDFVVRLELGIAGRVVDELGSPVSDAEVAVLDEDGRVVARGVSDMFGLYRLDAIVPGRYTVQVLADEEVIGRREVVVVDDYVFSQDVEVPALPTPGLQADAAVRSLPR